MGRIWAVCSGSGGAGKSMISLALASGAAKEGKKTILLDASGIARSCDLILGLESVIVLDMIDVISQQVSIESALYPVPRYDGMRFACAALRKDHSCSEYAGVILALASMCDILVVDLPTGQSDLGSGVMCRGDECVVVSRPDDASIRACERMLIEREADEASISLVLNHVSREHGRRRIQHTSDAVRSILDYPILASIPEDGSIDLCARKGRSAIECDGPAWNAVKGHLHALLSA